MLLQLESTIIGGKYRVDAYLGQGASAEVYRATHLRLGQSRALKVLRKGAPGVGSTEVGDLRQRFQVEAQLGARIKDDHVIQVFDVEDEGDLLVLAMEFAPGGSLAERLKRLRDLNLRMPVEEAVGVALDVSIGLAAIHNQDAVHRDLKPSNILFDANGRAKVADLGLAQIPGGPSLRSQLSAAQPHPGTPAYMSPEQERSGAYLRPNSDIYALGLILFEILTGRSFKNLRPGTRAASLREDIPLALDSLVARMLSTEQNERPVDGAETAQLLRATGVTPAWNKDEEWRRRLLVSTAAATQAVSTSHSSAVPTPAADVTATGAPVADDSIEARGVGPSDHAPEVATLATRPTLVKPRRPWLLPIIGLAATILVGAATIALLAGRSPTSLSPVETQITTLTTVAPRPSATPSAVNPAPSIAPAQAVDSTVAAVVPPTAPTAAPTSTPTLTPPTATPAPPSPTPTVPPPTPTPRRVDFNGQWQSNFATLSLNQNGDTVQGTYRIYGGPELSLRGTVSGQRLAGTFGRNPGDRFELTMDATQARFDGMWTSSDGASGHWCGVRDGALPEGCGFSGRWEMGGSFNSPKTIDPGPYYADMAQVGNQITGTYTDEEKNRVELSGTIGTQGYRATGQRKWWTPSGTLGGTGTFAFELLDFRGNQFKGWIAGPGTRKERCGWRQGFPQPTPCRLR